MMQRRSGIVCSYSTGQKLASLKGTDGSFVHSQQSAVATCPGAPESSSHRLLHFGNIYFDILLPSTPNLSVVSSSH